VKERKRKIRNTGEKNKSEKEERKAERKKSSFPEPFRSWL
jgi:hypothetical protein